MFKRPLQPLFKALRRYVPGLVLLLSRIRNLFSVMDRQTQRDVFLLQGFMLFSSVVTMLSLLSVVPFLSLAAIPEKIENNRWILMLKDFLGLETNSELIAALGLLSLLMLIFSHGLSILISVSSWRIRDRVSLDALSKIADYYLSSGREFHAATNSGVLFNKMFQKASTLISQGIQSILQFNRTMLTLFVAMFALFLLNPLLMVLCTLLMIGVLLFSILKNRGPIRNLHATIQVTQQENTRLAMETLHALEDIKIMGRERYFSQRMKEIRETNIRSNRMIGLINILFNPLIETVVYGVIVGMIIFYAIFLPTLNVIPELILFGLVAHRMMPIFKELFSLYMSLQNSMVIYDFVGEDMLLAYRRALPPPRTRQRIGYNSALEMKNVSYQYPGAHAEAITDINLSISRGSWVGFCGLSGSGKTTLMKVMLGLFPFKGEIQIDGRLLDSKTIPEWQNLLGYVSQNINLLDTSIVQNVTLGLPQELIDRERARKALEMADLGEFIDSLPDGIDSEVGEKGVRISGGQRQRIVIARALYNEPEVLIFDEATSALDNVAEHSIIKTLRQITGKQTLIMVAHRLGTIKDCDMLIFMKDGLIHDTGRYEELLERNTDFQHMVNKENKRDIDAKKSAKDTAARLAADSTAG